MNKWQCNLSFLLLAMAAPLVMAQSGTTPTNTPPSTSPSSTPSTTSPTSNPQNPTTPPEQRNTRNPTDPMNNNANRTQTPPPASAGWPSFEQADTDRDSSISATEFNSIVMARNSSSSVAISEIDTNGDGKISKEEWNVYRSGRAAKERK